MFATYAARLRAKALDSVGWLTAALLLTSGVVILAVVCESTWGWLVLVPLYAWLLFMILDT